MKILLKILMQNWGEKIFSNQQLEMKFYVRQVMIMVLEYSTLPYKKIWLSVTRCSHVATFISACIAVLMGIFTFSIMC